MAEGFYNHKRGGKFAISAGIVDSTHKYNGHPRQDVIQVMNEVGIDIHSRKIKQLNQKMLEAVEKIIVFCDKEICPEYLTSRSNVTYFKIEDPPDKDKTTDVIRDMRDKIKTITDNLK